jgi:hypothetical protein
MCSPVLPQRCDPKPVLLLLDACGFRDSPSLSLSLSLPFSLPPSLPLFLSLSFSPSHPLSPSLSLLSQRAAASAEPALRACWRRLRDEFWSAERLHAPARRSGQMAARLGPKGVVWESIAEGPAAAAGQAGDTAKADAAGKAGATKAGAVTARRSIASGSAGSTRLSELVGHLYVLFVPFAMIAPVRGWWHRVALYSFGSLMLLTGASVVQVT